MNPISGTFRYPPDGPNVADLRRFLADRKEAEELYMVVDEELKMMARICDSRIRVHGPYLKEMGRLAHTEYLLTGHSSRDRREILRETMFAPTVTGSPLENACRAIARHEPKGRGYYAGVVALFGRERGRPTLDASIAIRTADIDRGGALSLGVGATLVRHSDPGSEAAETRAKAEGLRAVLNGAGRPVTRTTTPRLGTHPEIRRSLRARNDGLSDFWRRGETATPHDTAFGGLRVLVLDAEDTFTAMLAYQLRSLGPAVTVRRFDEPFALPEYDVVVIGPGPGDPRDDDDDPKMRVLRDAVGQLLRHRQPFLAVCLGHQVLCRTLGLRLARLPQPHQGLQRTIDYFGGEQRVGFYHSFAAWCDTDSLFSPVVPWPIRVSRDRANGEVYGLWAPVFRSMQFHPESVLTESGPQILAEALASVSTRAPAALVG